MAILPVHQMIDRPDLVGSFQRGQLLGQATQDRQQKLADRDQVRSLAPGAIGGDADALAQVAAIDPTAATQFQAVADNQAQKFANWFDYTDKALQAARKSGNLAPVNAALQQGAGFISKLTGKPAPTAWTPDMDAGWEQLRAQRATIGTAGSGLPTGYRELEMKLRAAGYQPGTPEYENAVRVALGTEGRASSAAMQTVEVENSDGTTTTYTFDPRKGRYTPFSAGLGAQQPAQPAPPMPNQSDPSQVFASLKASVPGLRVTDEGIRTPEQNAALPNSVPNSYHLTGQAIDIGRPSPEQQAGIQQWALANGYEVVNNYADGHWHLEPAGGGAGSGGGGAMPGPIPGTSMAPGARKFAEESGTQQARIAAMPQVNQLEAQGAGMTTAAQEAARTAALPQQLQMQATGAGQAQEAKDRAQVRVELEQLLPKVRSDSDRAIALIDKALKHPGRAASTGLSSVNPLNLIPGSPAADFRAVLDQLRGGTFLQAFQSLKGGGAITQTEGTKAEQAIARLDTAQSDAEFIQALQELRDVAASLPVSVQRKLMAAGAAQPAAGNIARPSSEADYNALPSGALFIDPDDGRTYRKP